MSGKSKYILLDLIVPVLVLSFLAIILSIQHRGYLGIGSDGIEETFISQDQWEEIEAQAKLTETWSSDRSAFLLWDTNDENSVATFEQISFVLDSIGVPVSSQHVLIPSEKSHIQAKQISTLLPENCTDIILCFPSLISSGIDVSDLSSWVKAGGNIIFAAGLETEEISDELFPSENWQNLLGVKSFNIDHDVLVDSMIMQTSILSGANGMEFSDDVIQCEAADVDLESDCIVHIISGDDAHRPLLWEREYGNGHVLACNADLMDSKTNRGVIISCFSRMNTAFVYPVINAAIYCIDDFPSASPAGYETNVLGQFGYTVEDFYSNVWWPTMQRIAEQYGVKYSAFLIQCYEANVNGPFNNTNNQPSASHYTKLLLETGSELGLHGYNHQPLVLEGYEFDEKNSGYTCWNTVESMLDSIKAALAYSKTLSPDVNIQAYVAPSNVLSREAMDAMIRQFEDLRVYAGVYIGTPDQLVQEFSVLENDVVQVPRLTADMQMESSEWWLQVNELNYHYFESNYIHPDDILDEERSDGGDFSSMVSSYEGMVQWNQRYKLKTSTITEAAGAVQRYCNLSVSQTVDDSGILIRLNGLIDEAFLMLRTSKTPESISTGELTMIDDNCYLIRTEESEIRVDWSNK